MKKDNKYLKEQPQEIIQFGMIVGEEYKISEVYENIFGKELPQGGRQRKKQIENIDAYLISEKSSKRGYIKIIKFLDKPLKIIQDKRVNNTSHNIDTVVDLEAIIMRVVNNQFSGAMEEPILLSRNNALVKMGLVHENYKTTRNNIKDVAYNLNFDIAYLNEFFLRNHSQTLRKLERALERLHSQGYINFKECLIIWDKEKLQRRVATDEESDIILAIEEDVLREMDLRHKGQAYISGRWKKFKTRCEEYLYEKGLEYIDFYYKGYKIRATPKSIEIAVEDLEYSRSSLNVSDKIVDQCNRTTQKLRVEMLNSIDTKIESLKNVVLGEPPHGLIDIYENLRIKYMTINQHLIKGNIDEEINKLISKSK